MSAPQYVLEVIVRDEVQVTMSDGAKTTVTAGQAVALVYNMAAKKIRGALIVRGGCCRNQDVLDAALQAAALTGYEAAKAQASGRIEF